MSNFGKKLRTAGTMYVPSVIGEEYGGGYFAGRLKVDNEKYVIVVGGGSIDTSNITYSSTANNRLENSSYWNANTNQELAVAAGLTNYPAAKYCSELRTGGFSDWNVPTLPMMIEIYRNMKPTTSNNPTNTGVNDYSDPVKSNYTATDPSQTSLSNFQQGSSDAFNATFYWTSTLAPNAGAIMVQTMVNGSTGNSATNATRYLRPTRLVRVYD